MSELQTKEELPATPAMIVITAIIPSVIVIVRMIIIGMVVRLVIVRARGNAACKHCCKDDRRTQHEDKSQHGDLSNPPR